MKRIYWAVVLLAGIVLAGAMVTAQETSSKPTILQMQKMGPVTEMMGKGGEMGPMQQMGPMMQMMQNCQQMMGGAATSSQEPKK